MIYAIFIIAYLVINLLMSYVNVYTEAGFSSICMYWKNISIDRKCLHRFRGNNKGERRYKISLCKVCFLARKDKQRDREPSPFWPFYWPKRRIFLPFHILQLVKSLLFLYLKPKKGTPFARSLPIETIMWSIPRDKKHHMSPPEWTLLSNAHVSPCTKTRRPFHDS